MAVEGCGRGGLAAEQVRRRQHRTAANGRAPAAAKLNCHSIDPSAPPAMAKLMLGLGLGCLLAGAARGEPSPACA